MFKATDATTTITTIQHLFVQFERLQFKFITYNQFTYTQKEKERERESFVCKRLASNIKRNYLDERKLS